MTGALTAEAEEAATLQNDLLCILLRFQRQRCLKSLRHNAAEDDLKADAARLSLELSRAIGGRYVPKVFRAGSAERDQRDAAVLKAFNGRNRDEVLREFRISRRLFYSILARRRRG